MGLRSSSSQADIHAAELEKTYEPLRLHAIFPQAQTREPPSTESPTGPYGLTMPAGAASNVPAHTAANWPYDRILLDLLHWRRSLLARGHPIAEVISPSHFQAAFLALPDVPFTIGPLSRVITDLMLTFKEVRLPERVAFAWMVHRVLQVRSEQWRGSLQCLRSNQME